jgi:hypothetical protein
VGLILMRPGGGDVGGIEEEVVLEVWEAQII